MTTSIGLMLRSVAAAADAGKAGIGGDRRAAMASLPEEVRKLRTVARSEWDSRPWGSSGAWEQKPPKHSLGPK